MPFGPKHESVGKAIRLSFPSGEREVRAALGRMRQELARLRLEEEDTGTVELVLGEVLNNVVEHAYGAGRRGDIRMRCRLLRHGLAFCVCDGGRALPGLNLPSGDPPDLDCPRADLPEGGFGWFLVRSLTTGLAYARRGDCNVLRFNIPLRGPSPGLPV